MGADIAAFQAQRRQDGVEGTWSVAPEWQPDAVTFQGQAECVDAMVPLHLGGLSDAQQTLLNEGMQGIQTRRR